MSLADMPTRPARLAPALLLLGSNLVPLLGVLLWRWDAFLLLMLYWMETAIIAFWTFLRIAAARPAEMGDVEEGAAGRVAGRIALLLFFMAHSSIFMGVHFVFLWTLFSGDWSRTVQSPGDFLREIVLGSGLWLPLLFMFVVRGMTFGLDRLRAPAALAEAPGVGAIIGGLYARIVIMHMVVLFGGWLAAVDAGLGAILLLVALKTAADLALFVGWRGTRASAVTR